MQHSRFFVLLSSFCFLGTNLGCGSKDKDNGNPAIVDGPSPVSHTIAVGNWHFSYPMPAEVFIRNEGRTGPMAEDLDGFVRATNTGEDITLGGSFSHRPCEELKSLLDSESTDLALEHSLRHGVSITQTLRNDQYQLRVLAGFEAADGEECVSLSFHSRQDYQKEIDFTAQSAVRTVVLEILNSVKKQ